MYLPNVENAEIPQAKITDYLLNLGHSVGKPKAVFFTAFGFSLVEWYLLQAALLEHAHQHEISEVVQMPTGTHYIIIGELACPNGRSPLVKSIWRVDTGQKKPRFITAYPE